MIDSSNYSRDQEIVRELLVDHVGEEHFKERIINDRVDWLESIPRQDPEGTKFATFENGRCTYLRLFTPFLSDRLYFERPELELISELSHLEEIYIDNVPVELYKACFSKLRNLIKLGFNRIRFSNISADHFMGLTKVERLSFLHMVLEKEEDDNSYGPKKIILPHDLLRHMPSLRSFSLTDDTVESIPEGFFTYQTNFNWLHLHCENLTKVSSGIFNPINDIEIIRIFNSPLLSQLPADLFNLCPRLTTIDIRQCGFSQLPEGIFDNMPLLKHVDMKHNPITSLHKDLFVNNPEIYSVVFMTYHMSEVPTPEDLGIIARDGLTQRGSVWNTWKWLRTPDKKQGAI